MGKHSSGSEIVRDTLETDVYDVSQINAAETLYPGTWIWYKYVDRDHYVYPKNFAGLITEKFQDLRGLRSDPGLRAFLHQTWPFLPKEIFPWIENWRFDPDGIKMWQDADGHMDGNIIGPWGMRIPYEQISMAVSSQTRNEELNYLPDDNWHDTAIDYIQTLVDAGVTVSEFGMRRRAYNWMQDEITELLIKYGEGMYVGSSCPYHARMSGLSPKGTQGHQWKMFHAAKYGIENANQAAQIAWRAVYGTNLGTELTDTFTSDYYWNTLTPGMAQLIKSYRQDSGDPFLWTDHALRFLTDPHIRVDPSIITMMYSDALDCDKVIAINSYAKRWFKTSYGMGGFWTNNINFFKNTPAYKPLNIVVKPYAFSFDYGTTWTKVAKVPDNAGKNIGDSEVVAQYLKVIEKSPFKY